MILQIDLPDQTYQDLIAAFSTTYQALLVDPKTKQTSPNPQSKEDFARAQMVNALFSRLGQYSLQLAQKSILQQLQSIDVAITEVPSP